MNREKAKIINEVETKLIPLAVEVFSEDLLSILLYGSAARGNWRRNVSDLNILILLEKSFPQRIFLFGKKARNLIRRYRITPLLMSQEEFAGSADVFPMEYYDMAEAHQVLYGDSPVFPQPTRRNLRHQLEERLRGAVNDLRQILIAAGGRERVLGNHLRNWSGVPKTIFRGLTVLKGINPGAQSPEESLNFISREYGLDMGAFGNLERLRRGEKIPSAELTQGMLEALKTLAAAVDTMPEEEA